MNKSKLGTTTETSVRFFNNAITIIPMKPMNSRMIIFFRFDIFAEI